MKHERGAREGDGGGGEGKVSTRLTSATARYTRTKYRYNNAVQVRVPVRLSVPVHTSSISYCGDDDSKLFCIVEMMTPNYFVLWR